MCPWPVLEYLPCEYITHTVLALVKKKKEKIMKSRGTSEHSGITYTNILKGEDCIFQIKYL